MEREDKAVTASAHRSQRGRRHNEQHRSQRAGWLRAVVLGANDGTISVASLVVGIAASGATRDIILLSGLAATVAWAMSMAAGEFVSVQSQVDTERADLAKERRELLMDPAGELAELTEIYRQRGLDLVLARQVAEQLSLHDALGAHVRDELGLSETLRARPIQAARSSAASFAVGIGGPDRRDPAQPPAADQPGHHHQRPGGPGGPRRPGGPCGRGLAPEGSSEDAVLGGPGHGAHGGGRPSVRRGQSMSVSLSPGARDPEA